VTERAQSTSRLTRRRSGLRPRIVAGFVLAGVFFVSFLPVADKRALHTEGRLHVGLHFAVFTIVGFVALRAAHSRAWRVATFAGAVLFGFAMEEGEHLVYGGAMEWKDVFVDALGVTAGTLLAALSIIRNRQPNENSTLE
jgi:hypothetical protein